MSFRCLWIVLWGVVFGLTPLALAASFQKLENVRWLPHAGNDGDSFHAVYRGKEYIFRLYFVDTPESSDFFPDRIKDQTRYFKVNKRETLDGANYASQFTETLLARESFTVYTQWEDARGASRLPRYYAIVETARGENLAEALVQFGYARIYGWNPRTRLPDGRMPDEFIQSLKSLEKTAQSKGYGLWGDAQKVSDYVGLLRGKAVVSNAQDSLLSENSTQQATDAQARININEASAEMLESLPNIGPALAQRILDARPFRTLEDIVKVKGIGEKTLDNLLKNVTTHTGPPPPYTADYFAEESRFYINRLITVQLHYVEPTQEPAPEGYTLLVARTGNRGISGADIPLYVPNDLLDACLEAYPSQDVFRQQRKKNPHAPPPNYGIMARFFAYEGDYILVVDPPQP